MHKVFLQRQLVGQRAGQLVQGLRLRLGARLLRVVRLLGGIGRGRDAAVGRAGADEAAPVRLQAEDGGNGTEAADAAGIGGGALTEVGRQLEAAARLGNGGGLRRRRTRVGVGIGTKNAREHGPDRTENGINVINDIWSKLGTQT